DRRGRARRRGGGAEEAVARAGGRRRAFGRERERGRGVGVRPEGRTAGGAAGEVRVERPALGGRERGPGRREGAEVEEVLVRQGAHAPPSVPASAWRSFSSPSRTRVFTVPS